MEGMGTYKANRYGDRILEIVRQFRSRDGKPPAGNSGKRKKAEAETGSAYSGHKSALMEKLRATGNGSYREQVIRAGKTAAYGSWTAEEDAQLAEELRQHKTPKEMSEIHRRSRGAILSRLRKLKLI